MIAIQFGILLSREKLNRILDETSIEKNKQRASEIVNFETWDENTSIHGDHITGNGKTGNWSSCFTSDFTTLFKAKLGNFLIGLGYEKDNNWE